MISGPTPGARIHQSQPNRQAADPAEKNPAKVMPSSCHCLKQDLETHKPKKSEPKTHLATEKKIG